MGAKIVKVLLLLFCLFQICRSQETPDDIGANFCLTRGGMVDNLSCPEVPIEEGQCFNRSLLCNGVSNCTGGEDEGVTDLECKHTYVNVHACTCGAHLHSKVLTMSLKSLRSSIMCWLF